MDALPLLAAIDFATREAAVFAAAGFLLLGLSDLAVDIIWIGHRLKRRLFGPAPSISVAELPAPAYPGPMAIFVPAWDEAPVIADMLRHALRTFEHPDYRLYVGCYPNDPATAAAASAIEDPRLRIVVGRVPGPTTKADCLNRLWEKMAADERAEGRRFKAIVLHDAEDVVHSAELRLFDSLIERYDLVQLPVLPLLDPNSRWIAGHYADEFAESHGKELVVREAIGAALPSAGVGCAFSRDALDGLTAAAGAPPFDADSLTEDYELGLKLARSGGSACFVRMRGGANDALVLTREYFPGTLDAAVAQKARWMTGIALSGWDRLGWSGGAGERWMRLRDRQSVLAALLLSVGYAALLLWLATGLASILGLASPQPVGEPLATLLAINGALLGWRLGMRFAFVARAYGLSEGLRSIPRVIAANAIAMLAARRAVVRYLGVRRSGITAWEKTSHAFPAIVPAE
jgi:adsorption protein B